MNGKSFIPTEKKGFRREKKDVDHIEGGYEGKKNHFQNYNTLSLSSQIANVNFNSLFPTKKPETQDNRVKNQTKSLPRKNYQRI
jgi:hypothetical protein